MPVTSDYNPNYAQLVAQLTSTPSNVGAKDPNKQQQNAEQQGRMLEKISQARQASGPGSTGEPLPTGTSSSSLAPDSPDSAGAGLSSADYAGAVDSSLGAAGGDALGGAAGDALGAGLTGAAGGAAADAAAGGGITDLLGALL